jgi:hypothetical protein
MEQGEWKMKVWIVTRYYHYGEDREIEGVFSSEAAAVKWISEQEEPHDDYECYSEGYEVQS